MLTSLTIDSRGQTRGAYANSVNMSGKDIATFPTPDEPRLGPKMLALNNRQRAFVSALMALGTNNYSRAAAEAGYGGESRKGLAVIAHRLAHDQRIQEAMHEEAERRMHANAIMATSVVADLLASADEGIRLKAATAVLNRTGFHERTERRIVVEDARDDEAIKKRIMAAASQLGLDPHSLLGANATLPVIDVESEPASTTEGLEDIL